MYSTSYRRKADTLTERQGYLIIHLLQILSYRTRHFPKPLAWILQHPRVSSKSWYQCYIVLPRLYNFLSVHLQRRVGPLVKTSPSNLAQHSFSNVGPLLGLIIRTFCWQTKENNCNKLNYSTRCFKCWNMLYESVTWSKLFPNMFQHQSKEVGNETVPICSLRDVGLKCWNVVRPRL